MAENRAAPKVAVIMPAYNAREYIEASVKSVLAQSHRELELIVVNDGSADGTWDILMQLAAEDERLCPIDVKNGGPALARNRGLAEVSRDAEYIMFIDADDALAPDAIEYALSGAEGGAELVIFGYSIRGTDGSEREYSEPEERISRAELGGSLARLYKANLLNQVWGKLYSARLLRENNIRFQDYRWGEDRLFIFACLEHVREICVLPQCKYSYIMHKGESLITRYYDKKFAVCLEIDCRVEQLCRELGVTDEADFRYMFAKSVFSCLTNLYSRSCTLTVEEKRRVAKEITGNEQVKRRCRDTSGGLPTEVLCRVLASGSAGLTLAAFHAVARTGELAPALFIKLKHRK